MNAPRPAFRLLCSLAVASATVFAGEDPASFALVKGKAEASIKRYISASRTRLSQLDRIVKSGDPIGDDWNQTCANAARDLMDCRNELDDIYKDKGGLKGHDEASYKYIESEAQTWSNVASMGGELAFEYWKVKSYSVHIRDKEIPRIENEVEWCDSKINALNAAAEVIEKTRDGVPDEAGIILMGLEAARAMVGVIDEQVESWSGQKLTAAVLQKFKVRIADDHRRFRAAFDPDQYKGRIRAIIANNIDPDQRGVFRDHEKVWEKELEAAADDYDKAWGEYEAATKPLLEVQISATYAYFRSYSWTGLSKGHAAIEEASEEAKELLEETVEKMEDEAEKKEEEEDK